MKNTWFIVSLFLLTWGLTAQSNATIDSSEKASIAFKQLLEKEVVIGACAGIMVDGKVVWLEAAGYANLKTKAPFLDETLNRTASIAKPMTAMAVMQLVERGLIDLDVPIQTYIPSFPKKKEGTITTRHLLNHNSGIKGYKSGKEAETQDEYPTLADAVALFKDRELFGKPGEVYQYTSYGYTVLGLLIENVSGMTYEAYMKKHVWEPSGMTHTGIEKFGRAYTGKSELYHRSKNGKIKLSKKPNNLSNRIPAGGLYSTTEDLLKFGNAVMKHQLVGAATLEQMWKAPPVTNDGNPYGMGWFLYGENTLVGNVYGHTGEQTGTSSQLMVLPEINAVVVVMTNTSGALRDAFLTAVRLFAAAEDAREH